MVQSAVARAPPTDPEMDARRKALYEALFAKSAISDPTVEQVSNQRQQAISAAEAAKAVNADPNNLGGSTPGDISDYERKVAATQRLLGINGGQPPGPPDRTVWGRTTGRGTGGNSTRGWKRQRRPTFCELGL
jgi:hypothetical protein